MSGRCQHGRVLTDHDFHPDESTVRIFRTHSPGVLRLDDDVAISEAVYDRVVLRHYAFAGHWFKVNVTTGLSGRLTETGDGTRRFAVNCDIATPMEREGDSTFGVVARRTRPVRAVPASPGTADAARPGTRPPAPRSPPDLVTPGRLGRRGREQPGRAASTPRVGPVRLRSRVLAPRHRHLRRSTSN